jgi:hypothetical protein
MFDGDVIRGRRRSGEELVVYTSCASCPYLRGAHANQCMPQKIVDGVRRMIRDRYHSSHGHARPQTFEEVRREYDVTIDDIRAALKFVSEVAEQESFHPLPAA